MTLEEHNKLFWDRVCRWWLESEEAKEIRNRCIQDIICRMRKLVRREKIIKAIESQNREPEFWEYELYGLPYPFPSTTYRRIADRVEALVPRLPSRYHSPMQKDFR